MKNFKKKRHGVLKISPKVFKNEPKLVKTGKNLYFVHFDKKMTRVVINLISWMMNDYHQLKKNWLKQGMPQKFRQSCQEWGKLVKIGKKLVLYAFWLKKIHKEL